MPFNNFERFIALRYLKPLRSGGLLSIISWFSFFGICIGVATLIIVMSVMNGFRFELENRIIGFNGHIYVNNFDKYFEDISEEFEAIDGVDFIDVSSGGNSPYTVALMQELRESTKDPQSKNAVRPLYPGYQGEGAAYSKKESGLPVSTVGLITDPSHAESILCNDQADIIMLAREMLRDPNWPIRAAIALEQTEKVRIPVQYHLAWKGYGDFHYNPVSAPLLNDTGDVEEQETQ